MFPIVPGHEIVGKVTRVGEHVTSFKVGDLEGVGCIKKERIIDNINIFDFELSAADMDAISTLDIGKSLFFDHRDPAIVKWLGSRK